MAAKPSRFYVEGIPELRAALKATGGRELEKELGKVHKRLGEMVIAAAGGKQTGVGTGAGASIRPSAAVREVILRVGGKHRVGEGKTKPKQWGKNQVWPAPPRPHLIGAAERIMPSIEREYLEGIEQVWSNSWRFTGG